MRGPKTIASRRVTQRRAKAESSRPAARRAEELMELAVDAAQSRHLPEFLQRFAVRAARMLKASWGGVTVFRGRETDLYTAPGGKAFEDRSVGNWFVQSARGARKEISVREMPTEEGASPGGGSRSAVAITVAIAASDGEPLGALCLLRERKRIDSEEKQLLHALASHAALSIENFRRFSQLERSKRQWVEDIDAISDYIVVHDTAWKIVRPKLSLASHLGVPPVALVGEAMSSLRQIAETGSDLPCPFCRDTQRSKEENVAASAERIFLFSTSRTPSVSHDDTGTIPVLKNITDRRE